MFNKFEYRYCRLLGNNVDLNKNIRVWLGFMYYEGSYCGCSRVIGLLLFVIGLLFVF